MQEKDVAQTKSAIGFSFASLFDHLRRNHQAEFQDMPKGLIYYISRKEVKLLHYDASDQDVLTAIEERIDSRKRSEKNVLEFHVFTDKKEYRCLVSSRGSQIMPGNHPGMIEYFVSDESKGRGAGNNECNSFCDTVLLAKRVSGPLGMPESSYLKVMNYFDFDHHNGMLRINDYRLA
ncbi:MAG: hypothetical protein GX273_10400 [Bacteroidales bacterium]|nr:hypothetical protein [Bacteroidales bacterium]